MPIIFRDQDGDQPRILTVQRGADDSLLLLMHTTTPPDFPSISTTLRLTRDQCDALAAWLAMNPPGRAAQ